MAKGLDKVLLYYEDLIYCFEGRIKYFVIKDLKFLLLSKQHYYSYISHFGRDAANKLNIYFGWSQAYCYYSSVFCNRS